MSFISKLSAVFGFGRVNAHVLVIGLDNSGKTTMIHQIKAPASSKNKTSIKEVTPTVGFQVEEFAKNNISFTVFDMSGQGRYRNLWESYYADVQAIIYVIDSTDRLRVCVAKEELEILLKHADITSKNIPILFFANKMDVPGAMKPDECMEKLGLDQIQSKPWHIQQSNAKDGIGIPEGIDWLCRNISSNNSSKK